MFKWFWTIFLLGAPDSFPIWTYLIVARQLQLKQTNKQRIFLAPAQKFISPTFKSYTLSLRKQAQ